eukprot:SAG11_NODE_570_length_8454_cov_19.886655_5_plen_501_part_00
MRDPFVDIRALREIGDLVTDVRGRLEKLGISASSEPAAAGYAERILYVALFGAAFPNVFCGKRLRFQSVVGADVDEFHANADPTSCYIEVASARPDASKADIKAAFSRAGQIMKVENKYETQDFKHWLVQFQLRPPMCGNIHGRIDAALPQELLLALKLGDLATQPGAEYSSDLWQLAGASVGSPHRVAFVPADDRKAQPVGVAKDSANTVVLCRRTPQNLCMVCVRAHSLGCFTAWHLLSSAFVCHVSCAKIVFLTLTRICLQAFVSEAPPSRATKRRGPAPLLARCTTVLPSQWTLALPLLCAAFAPKPELRTDRRQTRVLGVKPVSSWEEIDFDSVIGQHDVETIQAVRYAVTRQLSSPRSATEGGGATLGQRLLDLLEPTEPRQQCIVRRRCPGHPLFRPDPARRARSAAVLGPIVGLRLGATLTTQDDSDDDERTLVNPRQKIEELWQQAFDGRHYTKCFLCTEQCSLRGAQLLKHLRGREHRQREQDYLRSQRN